jgi:hypothetical protein
VVLMLLTGARLGLGLLILIRSLRPGHPDRALSLQRLTDPAPACPRAE